MESSPALRTLRDRPFELLLELERRSRAGAAEQGRDTGPDREWVGVAFRMSGEVFLVAREETREVLGLPNAITRIPGARAWVKGLANVRGQLLPILDLRQYLGSGATQAGRNARVLVVVAEILLNRLLHPAAFDFSDVGSVVMDEFHNFADRERGIVWELSLGLLPRHVRLLLLSATVGNSGEFLGWLKRSHDRSCRQGNRMLRSGASLMPSTVVACWSGKKTSAS